MREKENNQTEVKPCWNYYNCPKKSLKKCPAYKMGFNCEQFSDCWFFIDDPSVGGPEKHGPCMECEWNQKYGFFKEDKPIR